MDSLTERIVTNILLEDIHIVDGQLAFNYDRKDTDGIRSTMGKTTGSKEKGTQQKFIPFSRQNDDVLGHIVWSVYTAAGANSTDITKALKKQSLISVDKNEYEKFIKRTALFIQTRIVKNNFDTIIAPNSSSPLIQDLLDELDSRLSGVKIFTDTFKKQIDTSKIRVDVDHPKITPLLVKRLTQKLASLKNGRVFKMKEIDVRYRKFITGYLELTKNLPMKYIEGKRVLIMDDLLASGTTMKEMIKEIELYAPENVEGVTIFKT